MVYSRKIYQCSATAQRTMFMYSLTKLELTTLKKLSTPQKIQDFLDSQPINWEKKGETYMSVRRTLRAKKMHCFEGALVAAAALYLQGEKPLLLDLKTNEGDDHVVSLYKRNGYWGAISKTNHATLRFRDPVYKTIRELALSYFHEYFNNKTRKKILRSFSRPFNLKRFGLAWITDEKNLFHIAEAIDHSPHTQITPKKNTRLLRQADRMELRAGKLIEWKISHPRT